jgi:hypothetical protein
MAKQVEPRVSPHLLWTQEGAFSGLHWRVVAWDHRASLLSALETHEQGRSKKPHA